MGIIVSRTECYHCGLYITGTIGKSIEIRHRACSVFYHNECYDKLIKEDTFKIKYITKDEVKDLIPD